MLYVMINPPREDIREMLDCIVASHRKNASQSDFDVLQEFLPIPYGGIPFDEMMSLGTCLLFYSQDYIPLGYVHFEYRKGSRKPLINIASTKFARPIDFLSATRYTREFIRRNIKWGCNLSISNDRVKKFARFLGYKPTARNDKLWA